MVSSGLDWSLDDKLVLVPASPKVADKRVQSALSFYNQMDSSEEDTTGTEDESSDSGEFSPKEHLCST